MSKVAVVGAGAIGATVGAWLTKRPAIDLTFCVRTPFEHLNVETPQGLITATPRQIVDLSKAETVDWVIVATKTYDALGAASWINALSDLNTRVAVLQNGVEHLSRFPSVNRDRIVPAIVDIPAERTKPGSVKQRRDGSIVVPANANGHDFAALFTDTSIDVQTVEDWQSAAWRKLAINCAGAVNALTMQPSGIARDAEIAELMRAFVRECVAVGRAEGAVLTDRLPDEVVDNYQNGPPDSINSIHADRLAGRQTEADARNGVIARLARQHGLSAPLNFMACILLKEGPAAV
ncbi:2-dehydropantoate 2-reductase [Sphingobium sp. AP50]|uniref:2-dehydropantoate 2-reductase n=1 Tax=Sphingobium sp. AP50 TaxID=1884369 RepID=UPI000B8701FE|nr:2-dehydropantoate 2-reductase [Sphingobium sp. AP50]